MDQSNNSTPDENNDNVVDSNAAPTSNPQPVSNPQPEPPVQQTLDETPDSNARPQEVPSETPPHEQVLAANNTQPKVDAPHGDSHLVLIALVVVIFIVLSIAAYFALAA